MRARHHRLASKDRATGYDLLHPRIREAARREEGPGTNSSSTCAESREHDGQRQQ